MTNQSLHRGRNTTLAAVIGTVLASYAGSATAIDWEFDNGARLAWNTTIGVGASWRVNDPDKDLYHYSNGLMRGYNDGRGGSATDSNTLNYDSGDRFATPFTLVTDLELRKGGWGALVRAKAWYDASLEDGKVRLGDQNNSYNGQMELNNPAALGNACPRDSLGNFVCNRDQWPKAKLSDKGFEDEVKFSNVFLLDAYVYGSFGIGNSDLQLRLGNQVVNWGESLFLPNVNQINPIDVPAARRPGTQIKEFLLPVWMAYANWGWNWGSIEAFYQFKWDNTALDTCGLYWGPAEGVVGTDPAGCGSVTTFGSALAWNNVVQQSNGIYFPAVKGEDAKDSGIFGAALRFPVNAIDTEFGLYYMNLHSTLPNVSSQVNSVPSESIFCANGGCAPYGLPDGTPIYLAAQDDPTGGGGLWTPTVLALRNPAQLQANIAAVNGTPIAVSHGFWEYSEDKQIIGLSAATNLFSWSTSFELSYQIDVPAQINGNDLVQAALGLVGPAGQRAIAAREDKRAGGSGYLRGYDLFDVTQFNFNALKTFSSVPFVKADTGLFIFEAGFRWNNVPDYKKGGVRYGRGFIYGSAYSPEGAAAVEAVSGGAISASNWNPCNEFTTVPDGQGGTVEIPTPNYNRQPNGCKQDGYVTDFSWGYRMRWTMSYLNVGGSGITITPKIYWAHDPDGVSITPHFNEGRQTLGLGMDFIYNKRYKVGADYTYYSDSDYDPLFDRDYFSLNASVTF